MWCIVKDMLTGGRFSVLSNDWKVQRSMTIPYLFELRDGDDIPYFYGYNTEKDFRPLDEHGRGDSGCTSIFYKHQGEWEEL